MTFEKSLVGEDDTNQAILFYVGHDSAHTIDEIHYMLVTESYFLTLTIQDVRRRCAALVEAGKLIYHIGEGDYSTPSMPTNY